MHIGFYKILITILLTAGCAFANGQVAKPKQPAAAAISFSCSEKTIPSDVEDMKDSVYITTCVFKNFKTVDTASPSYSGKYYHVYELYQKKNGKYVPIAVSELIVPGKANELRRMINAGIQKQFKEMYVEESKDCFPENFKLPYYDLDDFDVYIEGDQMVFRINFGLSSYCDNVGGADAHFKIRWLWSYLR